MTTIYASIGNSDDKLTQQRWADFLSDFVDEINQLAEAIHGIWYSAPDAPFQNACVCFEIEQSAIDELNAELASLAAEYGQDSIAWAIAETEFIKAAS